MKLSWIFLFQFPLWVVEGFLFPHKAAPQHYLNRLTRQSATGLNTFPTTRVQRLSIHKSSVNLPKTSTIDANQAKVVILQDLVRRLRSERDSLQLNTDQTRQRDETQQADLLKQEQAWKQQAAEYQSQLEALQSQLETDRKQHQTAMNNAREKQQERLQQLEIEHETERREWQSQQTQQRRDFDLKIQKLTQQQTETVQSLEQDVLRLRGELGVATQNLEQERHARRQQQAHAQTDNKEQIQIAEAAVNAAQRREQAAQHELAQAQAALVQQKVQAKTQANMWQQELKDAQEMVLQLRQQLKKASKQETFSSRSTSSPVRKVESTNEDKAIESTVSSTRSFSQSLPEEPETSSNNRPGLWGRIRRKLSRNKSGRR